MHIYLTAPEGQSLTRQELDECLKQAGIEHVGWGVSEQPFRIETETAGLRSIIAASGADGRLRSISIENSRGRGVERLCKMFDAKGWIVDGE